MAENERRETREVSLCGGVEEGEYHLPCLMSDLTMGAAASGDFPIKDVSLLWSYWVAG